MFEGTLVNCGTDDCAKASVKTLAKATRSLMAIIITIDQVPTGKKIQRRRRNKSP
jgi:hypothetical protein